MTTIPTELIGDAYTSTHHWDLLCKLVDLDGRMAGQEGERKATCLIADTFESHGVQDVSVTEFDVPGWWRGSSSLKVGVAERKHQFNADHQVIALPGTRSCNISGELIDVGYGRPEDFDATDCDGKIVMASSKTPESYNRWIHRGEKYGFAINHGARAFIFRNHIEGNLPPTGSIGNKDGPGEIPAVGVSKEVGERFARYCEAESVDVTLTIDCRNESTNSQNVEGVLGPDTTEEVLLVAHADGHDISEAARDNGVGTVLVSELARLLAQMETDLETCVRFLVFGSEEIGLLGSNRWVETHPRNQVKAVLNLDGTGYSRNLSVYTHRFDRIAAVFEEVADELEIPISISNEVRPHSDHWPFVQEGIPAVQTRSLENYSGRGWVHTHADTLDKLELRDLRELVVPLAMATAKLAEADRPIYHKAASSIRDAIVEDGHAIGMRNAGSWPFDDE